MNKNIKIPNTWKWVTLNDISVTSSGGTPNRKNSSYFNGNIPWVKSGELNYNTINETEEHISEEALAFSSAKIFPKGSLLIALYGNTVGRMAFLGIDAATNQAVASITSFLINPKYLFYYLMASKEDLLNKREGSAQPNISQKVLNEFPFPLAPIEEQNRIVDKIEELFSEIDRSIEILQLAKDKIKTNIFSLYNQIFNKNNIGANISIRNLCQINYGKSLIKKERKNGEIPVYGSNGIIGYHNETYIEKSVIIIGRKGSVGELRYSKEKCFPIDTTYYIEDDNSFDLKYLFYQLHIKELSQLSKSTTIPGLNREHIYEVKVKMPSIEEQESVVKYIDEKLNDYEVLETNILETINKTKIIYSKILLDAFGGKLSKQYKSDESVLNLLEQIQLTKETYKIEQNNLIKNKIKITNDINLLESIIDVFDGKSFDYFSLSKSIKISNEKLKKEFEKLLNENKLKKHFDNDSKSIKYKLK